MGRTSGEVRSVLAILASIALSACEPRDVVPGFPKSKHDIKVLDGDTLIFDGRLVRVAGIDAPELGPWAKCWAEAAVGGVSKHALEAAVSAPGARNWELRSVTGPDQQGRVRATLVSDEGEDLADHMVVYGYAAKTTGRWNRCGPDANLHQPLEGEPEPRGPSLWWPSNRMFDARAGD
ncbi:thermonuclease family protein [Phenylobacterium sp.]|uniref:thermonuclease family protein n=1 Tax=Phenylobacterium sp. TaxID=1871053 RepID=UPI00392B9123